MMTFHDLYTSYARDVFRFAYWLTGNVCEAEDITSETFVRAWVRIATIRTETLKGYLFAIARNLYLGQLRRDRKLTALQENFPGSAPDPETITADRAVLEWINEFLASISEMDRTAFLLRVQHDLPYAEIARILVISISSAKVKVHRVRKRILQKRLDQDR